MTTQPPPLPPRAKRSPEGEWTRVDALYEAASFVRAFDQPGAEVFHRPTVQRLVKGLEAMARSAEKRLSDLAACHRCGGALYTYEAGWARAGDWWAHRGSPCGDPKPEPAPLAASDSDDPAHTDGAR